jgi:cell wall-associated NlpC family hydrolase
MKKWVMLAGLFFVGRAGAEVLEKPVEMVVKVPVANVRAKPIKHSGKYKYDDLQETQVEQGEKVRVFEKKGSWVRVECPEQEEFTHNSKWQGYPGWMEASALTDDMTQAKTIDRPNAPLDQLRREILAEAAKHFGERYLWGGRSLHDPQNKKVATGVDCSGLINWSFRQVGWIIPRDAHEQFMRAHSVRPFLMRPADLIFLAKTDNPHKIVHIAFYAGNDELIEAPQSGERVRKISFQERFGKSIKELKGGDTVGDRIIYFGTLFDE